MFPVTPSFPPTNITTEQIQKYLDENKKLILAILGNQNPGKLAECAQYQAQLQKNLMYLAAIADAQPQTPAMPPQMVPHPAMQQGGFYMQQPQAADIGQQPSTFPQRASLQFNNLHQQHLSQHLPQPQAVQGHMDMRPTGASNGMHPTYNEANLGGSGLVLNSGPAAIRGGSKQDRPAEGSSGADGQGTSAYGGGDGKGAK
ncbi:Hypothetical predicted protein [Olea europaea subsp. europaea]|uniref:SS18 N-terminal domain-containing protein n=2 Tax=Olea europaea subsp. europaea TaxID=158383 RepID=A0A8S0UY62_OLEEU|nr:Hypothetical predicted protein [Olea europaea subsp. europaea]